LKDYNENLLQKMIEAKSNYRDISLEHWWNAEFNRWNWWLSLVLAIIPLYIWWKLLDKKRILEICLYGLLINIFSSYLDVYGSGYVLWEYPVRLIPNIPRIFPIDATVIPVVYMLIYQYFPKWKQFIIAHVIIAAVFAFVMEPMLVWMNLYRLMTWKFIYSFPIYIIMAVVCKATVIFFMKVQKKATKQFSK